MRRRRAYESGLAGLSIYDGLLLIDKDTSLTIIDFGATYYRHYGWVTESGIPRFKNVGEFVSFLKLEGDIGIIVFEVTLGNLGWLSTSNDTECHFTFKSKSHCLAILKSVISPQYRDNVINKLVSNQRLYLACSSTGDITKYATFSDYLKM